ncbi:MAG TPA: hypothetical protein VEP67_05750 [Thiobacillaceae bacterium]|nr:hypothetical protein [Thiobacillaceae bacterium]
MKSIITKFVFSTLVFSFAVSAGAASPGTTGQPNQSCEETRNTPGNSATAPGSAFNPNGKAGTVYAGEQPQNSNNPKSVSQYDVACFEQPSDDGDFLLY